jgi:hypothetical protein
VDLRHRGIAHRRHRHRPDDGPDHRDLALTRCPASTKDPSTALEIAAAQHLSQSEAYLTLFRPRCAPTTWTGLPVAAARQLLATNRLLLDSPVGDARLRPLLLDLELVLAEITQLGTTSARMMSS